MNNILRPINITANRRSRELIVDWRDGHTSTYSFTLLRNVCPCAECRGGHDNMGVLPDAEIFLLPDRESPATRLRNVESVGTYAITLEWEDGHHYGIYRWDYLRAICPCKECEEKYRS
jgi:DUF971 family protein